jgi:hypothetical protein
MRPRQLSTLFVSLTHWHHKCEQIVSLKPVSDPSEELGVSSFALVRAQFDIRDSKQSLGTLAFFFAYANKFCLRTFHRTIKNVPAAHNGMPFLAILPGVSAFTGLWQVI